MLPALRAVLPEFARGISTAIALAAVPRCPEQHCQPVFPEAVRCPDCVCQGALRVPIEEPIPSCGALWYSLSDLVIALLLGCIIGYWCRGYQTVEGFPVPPVASQPTSIVSSSRPVSQPESNNRSPISAAAKALARYPEIEDSEQ